MTIVAQNPGEDEENVGKPLVGRSGTMVMSALAKGGLGRDKTNLCNILKCRYTQDGKKVNIIPQGNETDAAVRHCIMAHFRVPETNSYIVMGDLALKYGTGLEGIENWRGSTVVAPGGLLKGRKVTVTVHPAAIFRKLEWRATWSVDFRRGLIEAKDSKPVREARYASDNFMLGVDGYCFYETLQALSREEKTIALDVETTRDKPIDAKLHTIGIAWSATDAMNYCYGSEWDEKIIQALSEYRGRIVTATPFDYTVLTLYGVQFPWERCHDMTLLHSRFDIELPHTLDFIASMMTDRPYWKFLAATEPLKYNALDCVAEWECFYKLARHCQTEEAEVWKCYENDRKMIPIVVKLHINGIPTEKKLIDAEREWYEHSRDIKKAELLSAFESDIPRSPSPGQCPDHPRFTGKTPVRIRKNESHACEHCQRLFEYVNANKPLNLSSRQQVMRVLKNIGMEMFVDRKTGRESLDKAHTFDLYRKYGDPRLLKLLEFWEDSTVLSRYFKEAWICKKTGRIHPTYSLHSAMHRWSCRDPNMQQQKKPEREEVNEE